MRHGMRSVPKRQPSRKRGSSTITLKLTGSQLSLG